MITHILDRAERLKLRLKKGRLGQSTLEYLIVLAVIIAAIVAISVTVMRPAVETSMDSLGNYIEKAAEEF